jgi:hypothetical protein
MESVSRVRARFVSSVLSGNWSVASFEFRSVASFELRSVAAFELRSVAAFELRSVAAFEIRSVVACEIFSSLKFPWLPGFLNSLRV